MENSLADDEIDIRISEDNNSKLGDSVYSFSLPAAITCPLAESCLNYCYVRLMHPGAHMRYLKNYLFIRRRGMSAARRELSRQLRQADPSWFRLHVSGDFFSRAYVKMWIDLCREHRLRGVVYTRSLARFPEILDLDRYLKVWISLTYPELESWASPELLRGRRLAIALTDEREAVERELGAFLRAVRPDRVVIFRNHPLRGRVLKRFAGELVCPAENGITHKGCSSCWYCYSSLR